MSRPYVHRDTHCTADALRALRSAAGGDRAGNSAVAASGVDDPARFGVGSGLLGIVDRDVQVACRRHSEADESMCGLPVVKAARLQRGHLVEPLVVDRKRCRPGRIVGMGPWLIAAAVSGKYIALVELEEPVGRPGD